MELGHLQHHGAGSPLFLHLTRPPTLHRKLTEEEASEVRYAFEKLAGESKVISRRQLKVALRAMGFAVKKADVATLLRDNGYGDAAALDFDSFSEVVSAKITERSPGEEVKRAFSLFDLESSGRITARDLALIAKQLQCNIEPEEIKDMIEEFDKDGDGAINEAEFRGIMAAYDD